MDTDIPQLWRDEVVAWAADIPRARLVVAYGSRATGRARPDSDLDLAITFTENDRDTAAGLWMVTGEALAAGLQPRIPVRVDLRCTQYPGAPAEWLANVRRDAIVIFERN